MGTEPSLTDCSNAVSNTLNDETRFYIPDFCAGRRVLLVVLAAELVAIVLMLSRPTANWLADLALLSMFVQWLGLTGAAVLCLSRRWLAGMPVAQASGVAMVLLLLNTLALSELTVWFAAWLSGRGVVLPLLPQDHVAFLLRNVVISGIVSALVLRYFFVTHEWRRNVEAENRSRIDALQARIRPHFLFNSMNTIAALTRSSPSEAEEAVEDLADLFRATLKDSGSTHSIKEELELARIYQRIEQLRLGDRLAVDWDVDGLPMRAQIPSLTLQPLLENAIYHGIERLKDGGRVTIAGGTKAGVLWLRVNNPIPKDGKDSPGNQLALANIKERFALAYGKGANTVAGPTDDGHFQVLLEFPADGTTAGVTS